MVKETDPVRSKKCLAAIFILLLSHHSSNPATSLNPRSWIEFYFGDGISIGNPGDFLEWVTLENLLTHDPHRR